MAFNESGKELIFFLHMQLVISSQSKLLFNWHFMLKIPSFRLLQTIQLFHSVQNSFHFLNPETNINTYKRKHSQN